MSQVRIISTSKVQLPVGTDYPPPSSIIQLSHFDVGWIQYQPMKTLLLYPSATISSSSLHSFKSSLSLVLNHFHPLVGDLTYLPESDDIAIVCSDESGVTVIEAESDLDVCRLAGDPTHDVESFFQLVPNTFHEELPMPVLTVQFTKFSRGGVAVGISIHHTAMDAWGAWKFIDCWAKTSCDGVLQSGLAPVHDRAVFVYPGNEEIKKEKLNSHAPDRPKINSFASVSDLKKLTRRVFTLDLTTIQLLKQQAIQETTADNSFSPTTFQVLVAHIWISIARTRGITSENNKPTFMIGIIDGRTLLPSPMSHSYTGNCLFPCIVHSTGSKLMSANGFGETCGTIADTVRTNKDRIKEGNGQGRAFNFASLSGLMVCFAGSNKLDVYGTDFGWGTPGLSALVSMNGDGNVVMTAGKEKGSVQITVGLKQDMDAFILAFEGGLNSLKQLPQAVQN